MCYCCLDEGDKVALVMNRFAPVSCKDAQDANLMMLVGRVILCNYPMYAPATGMPCVWYHILVEQEVIEHRTRTVSDGHGGQRTENYTERVWRHLVEKTEFQDFFLQDGNQKVFINGQKPGFCKINGETDAGGGATIFTQPPPGVQWLIMQVPLESRF